MPKTPKRSASGRKTNLALLALLPIAVLSGLFSNAIGRDWVLDPVVVHAIAAVAIATLAPWKSIVVRRGLRRRKSTRWMSLGLMTLVLVTLASGLAHASGLVSSVGPLTVMQVHIGSALLGLVVLGSHVRAHPQIPRRIDLDRRAVVRSMSLVAASSLTVVSLEAVAAVIGLPGAERRFTGSHERGSFDVRQLPVTSWLDDQVQHIDQSSWRVDIDGREVGLAGLARLPVEEMTAVLDCTSGWYSEQLWRGIRLDRLVDAAHARSIEVRSVTGYSRRFPARDAKRLWLVTHVGGSPLEPSHGFPARIVAPDRRGFWWVKWVGSISTSELPWWLQLPFPAA